MGEEKKKGQYTIVDNIIIQHYLPLLGTGPFALWCILRQRCNKDKECFSSLWSLAKALNLSCRRDVIRYRQSLLDAGLLKILRRGHSSGYSTYYKVIVPTDATLLDVVRKTTKKLKINGRKKVARSTGGTNATGGNSATTKTRQVVAQMHETGGITATSVVAQTPHQLQEVQHNKQQSEISDKPSTQLNNPLEAIPGTPLNAKEFLGKKYLDGKSPEELQALEARARKEMQEAGIGENIIRVALRTQMALIAKEEAIE